MDNGISTSQLEQLLARRSGYNMGDDCPHMEDIAAALEGGDSPAQILKRFPHVNDCELCRESLLLFAQMNDTDTSIADITPLGSRPLVAQVHLRSSGRHRPIPAPQSSRGRTRVVPWALAAVLLVGICGGIGAFVWKYRAENPSQTSLTPKGAFFDLEIAVSREGTAFPLHQGDMVKTGDQLGFFYTATQSAYIAVFHVDADGQISVLYPGKSDRSVPVQEGARIPLSDGAIVTPATSCEWIVAVFSNKDMSVSQLRRHLLKELHISESCTLHIGDIHEMNVRIQQIRN